MNRRYSSALKRVLNKTMLRWIEMVSRQTQSTQGTAVQDTLYRAGIWDPCVMISVSCGFLVQYCTALYRELCSTRRGTLPRPLVAGQEKCVCI